MKKSLLIIVLLCVGIAVFSGCGYSRKAGCPMQDGLMN
jgi:hypothetical protein